MAERPAEPGWVPIHRLNSAEYDNTIRDLLGVEGNLARTTFVPDEEFHGFDSIAEALGMTDARYQQYFDAAHTLVDSAFASRTLRDRLLTCAPGADGGAACARSIIEAFGRRAWRRPLRAAESARLVQAVMDAQALGEGFAGGVRQALTIMLASPHFLYRIETAPAGEKGDTHALDPYALASRLSYLVWSTTPDDELLAAAASGALLKDDGLEAQLDRLVNAPRARNMSTGFGAQWLGARRLLGHQVEPTAYPSWDESLRRALVDESAAFVTAFLRERPMTEFFTTRTAFVNARLAKHYGDAGKFPAEELVPIERSAGPRRGFLGLGTFLTVTSFSYRTSPTLRGTWILENLLCEHVPPPPPQVEGLDDEVDPRVVQSQNVRERVEQHRRQPACAGCHAILDPFGLGLESFDAIGRHRERYPNGDLVDASGKLPDGTAFNGLSELSSALARDGRFADCVVEKVATYALSRGLTGADRPYLQELRRRWVSSGATLRALLAEIVLSKPFRHRRREAPAGESQP